MATHHTHVHPGTEPRSSTDPLSVFLLILLIALVVGVALYIWGRPGGGDGGSPAGTQIEGRINVPEGTGTQTQ